MIVGNGPVDDYFPVYHYLQGCHDYMELAQELVNIHRVSVGRPVNTDLPSYIKGPLDRQSNPAKLKDIAEYCLALARYQEQQQEVDLESEVQEDEEIVEVEQQSSGPTRVWKKVPCGKECSGCPHGPYLYLVQRTGSGLSWDYVGKNP